MAKRKAEAPTTFNNDNYHHLCDHLASKDDDLKAILNNHGYPPRWTRENSFETLVHIILEQQVSLASALAALNKLREQTNDLTPDNLLILSDEEMRAYFVSRQKTGYLRGLAQAIKSGEINLDELKDMHNDKVRERLIGLKGIGNWTVDVYLMFVLQRVDIFPIGDLAAVNAVRRLKNLGPSSTKDDILKISGQWAPFRSVASMMLWHYYLSTATGKRPS